MRVELFGYYLYPAFFITVIGVPLLIVGLIILLRRLKEKRQVYATSIITTWEKKYLPKIIEKEKKTTDNESYIAILNELKEYIADCNYWNTDELLEIDKDEIIILTNFFFEQVKVKHNENPDKCVLLLHAIDNINGGIDYDLGNHWMADDMVSLQNHEKMGIDEAKVLALCEGTIEKAVSQYVNLDTNKIPVVTAAISEMVGMEREDFGSALRDVVHCIDFTDLKESTFEILELVFIDAIEKIINSQKEDFFDEYYLSYIRTLASIIDRQLYDDVLKTIEK